MKTSPTNDVSWTRRLIVAAVTGLITGIARALADWVLNH
jgi:hypothetical protein